MKIIKEKKGFRLEAYQDNNECDYYITNLNNKTWSFCIRNFEKALEEFKRVVERNYI